jgi:hypothetical protein
MMKNPSPGPMTLVARTLRGLDWQFAADVAVDLSFFVLGRWRGTQHTCLKSQE